MKIRVLPLDFAQQGGMVMPRNAELHRMAAQFAHDEMGCIPNFAQYARVFVACELDASGEPQKIVGLTGIRMVPDVELIRYLHGKAATKLIERGHDWLIDQGAQRGSDLLVRIAENDHKHLCDQYLRWLVRENAVPAERWILPVR